MIARTTSYRTLFLALLIASSLAACGDDSGSQTESPSADAGDEHDADDTHDADGDDTSLPDTDTGGLDDDCTFVPDPSLASGESAELAGMTARHNMWRERVGVARLAWNTELAASAKAYAEECVWEHSDDRSPDAGYDSVGENLAWTSQQLSAFGAENAVQMWVDERYDWDFGMNVGDGNFSAYGHYTQVVWHSTEEVGCGAAYCDNTVGIGSAGTVIVCRYGPAGNFTGRAPYEDTNGACLDLDNDDVLQSDDADDTDRSVQ
jgi:uncharacterized protein YkwD